MIEQLLDAELDPLGGLAEEFLTRWRQGKPTSVESFALDHPELASEIRALFPTLILLEVNRPDSVISTPEDRSEEPHSDDGLPRRLGEYTLTHELGRGGMGIVFEAWQGALDRRVAIKILPGTTLSHQRGRLRFLHEARIIARLRHPHIVPIHSVGEHEGVLFYVMDLIPGTSLDQPEFRDLPTATGSTRANWVADLGIQAAETLAYAHGQGVLHRDVKPSNLLLDPDGKLWLMDFGLAKLLDDPSLTPSGEWLGTLRYLAPECLRGEASVRSDIYGLGLTLYELLVGVPAFDETDRIRLLQQIAAAEFVPPRCLDPTIPPDLETIILKAIEGDPARRYQVATGLAEDLRRFLDGRPIDARRGGAAQRLVRWLRSHPALTLLATTTIVLAISTIFLVWHSFRGPARTNRGADSPAASLTASAPSEPAKSLQPAADQRREGPPWGWGRRHAPAGPGAGAGGGRGFGGPPRGMPQP